MFGVARSLYSACLAGADDDACAGFLPRRDTSTGDDERKARLGPMLGAHFDSARTIRQSLLVRLDAERANSRGSTPDLIRPMRSPGSRSLAGDIPTVFLISAIPQDLLEMRTTRVHDERARPRVNAEVPVCRAGVPEPAALDRLVSACARALEHKQILKVQAPGDGSSLHPHAREKAAAEARALERLITIALDISTDVRDRRTARRTDPARPESKEFWDPEFVLAACARQPPAVREALTEEQLASLLAYVGWAEVMPSPSADARVPRADVDLSTVFTAMEKEKGPASRRMPAPERTFEPRAGWRADLNQSKV
jgi:hypothetical protein